MTTLSKILDTIKRLSPEDRLKCAECEEMAWQLVDDYGNEGKLALVAVVMSFVEEDNESIRAKDRASK